MAATNYIQLPSDLITLTLWGRVWRIVQKKRGAFIGDHEVWPFYRIADYEESLKAASAVERDHPKTD